MSFGTEQKQEIVKEYALSEGKKGFQRVKVVWLTGGSIS